ncbi:sugar ABC transporter substrate-binding protein [Planobispora rosea]|uniref:Sugar ABC transporter substrate-binding protein n=1 Tax=Planobispora rosea TaxID=35762 RepID=A0A8J3RYP5_PLARO|nr:extracellular solute-binding protein [Planobispora rosea]GGS55684.1 sugar ABC transporter substrate-binding protein [Planobispora rosea]GIH83654.1 sugar ABC transporter substrate-binding protein [Planobispora rosea]
MRLSPRPALIAALAAALLALASCGSDTPEGEGSVTLTITANAIPGGKNSASADWIRQWVIPRFEAAQKAAGRDVRVLFQPNGVDDEQYKTKIALDLKSRTGADVIDLDGIWVGEFAQAGYVKPLSEVGGPQVDAWEGWAQIPQAVQGLGIFDGKKYGLPQGTDGRVLFYNKELFARAGLPDPWQPTSWQEIIDAGTALRKLPGVTPIQINAGTAMGEATTMQGALPLLAGTGTEIYADGKWTGASQGIKDVLGFYRQIYGGGLGDPRLQQEAKGRDKSFAEFADGKIGILAEGDYFWRSVVEPQAGVAPMADRDEVVGYAKIPAREPGAGVRGQDFVSMSGGAVRVLNPFSQNPRQAWELMAFMHSAEAIKAELAGAARVTSRTDVNDEVLAGDPMLTFIAKEILPITSYRPGLAVYPQVSAALQEATAAVVSGTPPEEAANAYRAKVEGIVGGPGNVSN